MTISRSKDRRKSIYGKCYRCCSMMFGENGLLFYLRTVRTCCELREMKREEFDAMLRKDTYEGIIPLEILMERPKNV